MVLMRRVIRIFKQMLEDIPSLTAYDRVVILDALKGAIKWAIDKEFDEGKKIEP